MTWMSAAAPVAFGTGLAAMVLAATALVTAHPSRADCADVAVGAESCVADCADDQVRDDSSGQCTAKANEDAEALLQTAWEQAFGPLPAAGLPGAGVDLSSIAPSISSAAAALPALALQAQQLPPPPPLPCFGFATPIPFVGFSTC